MPTELSDLAAYSVVPGRISDRTATLSIIAHEAAEVTVTCESSATGIQHSRRVSLPAGQPAEIVFDTLRVNTEYTYALRTAGESHTRPQPLATGRFHTQRAAGSSFVFTIQGDSHPERPQMFDPTLYALTLQSVAADQADFHICMGDDFSISKLPDLTHDAVASRYALQRPFLGIVGRSAPVFLINGNHEQASLFNYNQPGLAHSAAVWAQTARNHLFPMPVPEGIYYGNSEPLDPIGLLRDYYAWIWGDALFVVLDNYWHSPACVDTRLSEDEARRKPGDKQRSWWDITLGNEQYRWFRGILESSQAKFKFVFTHHVLGSGRGGVERAQLYEWGGRSERGGDEFKARRPGWSLPIHQLMVKHGVSVFFQGHDHLYAMQELDGMIYQTTPVPADPSYSIYNSEHYLSGVKHPNSGHLRVTVEPRQARVEYVRSYLQKDLGINRRQSEVTHSYIVHPRP